MTIGVLQLIWCGLLGLALGSFLNVVIYRLPRKCMTIFGGRSFCPQCLAKIAWFDNVPLLSYLMLGGKCRRCRRAISPRYFIVETITGGFILLLGYKFLVDWSGDNFVAHTWPLFLIYGAYVCALVAITFIDIDLRIIPNEISIGGMILAPLISLVYPALQGKSVENLPWSAYLMRLPWGENLASLSSSLMGLIFGGGLIYVVAVIGRLIFRKEAMGGGDLKLLAMIGAIVGWQGALVVFLVACIVGAICGAIIMIVTKEHYMPFGPYIALGAVVYLFLGDQLAAGYHWYIGLFNP